MKRIKILIAIIAVSVYFIIICGIINYFADDDYTSYTRLMMHEFYNQDNIDVLLVGASHSYRGIDPVIVSEKTGKNVFNASSSAQRPDASLALIKEAINLYDVEHVYLETSSGIASSTGKFSERTEMISTYLISDYMKPSLNKYKFLLRASSAEHYINGLFIGRRDWKSLFDWEHLTSVFEKKQSHAYKTYSYECAVHENEKYMGKGYVASDICIEASGFYTSEGNEHFNADDISDDWRNTIWEIINVCRENNIELTLYSAPVSFFQLVSDGNYDGFIQYMERFVEGTDVPYVDFNLIGPEYFPNKMENYKDSTHLNMYGAELFSNVIAGYMNGSIPETAFCKTLAERMEFEPVEYYGISYYVDEEKDDGTRKLRLISSHPDMMEYRVIRTPIGGEPIMVQDFDFHNEITIPGNQEGMLTVSFRAMTNRNNVMTVESLY